MSKMLICVVDRDYTGSIAQPVRLIMLILDSDDRC